MVIAVRHGAEGESPALLALADARQAGAVPRAAKAAGEGGAVALCVRGVRGAAVAARRSARLLPRTHERAAAPAGASAGAGIANAVASAWRGRAAGTLLGAGGAIPAVHAPTLAARPTQPVALRTSGRARSARSSRAAALAACGAALAHVARIGGTAGALRRTGLPEVAMHARTGASLRA